MADTSELPVLEKEAPITEHVEEVKENSEVKEPRKPLKEELRHELNKIKEREDTKLAKEPLETGKKDKQVKSNTAITDSVKEAKPVKENIQEKPSIPAPASWKTETKAEWNKLPKVIQEEVVRRETEITKKLSEVDEERHFGKKMRDTITPYLPLIQSENSDPERAVRQLLNTAYTLRNSTPAQKGVMLWQLAEQYGADMRMTPQAATQPGFQLQTLQQELAKTKEELTRLPQMLQQQQEEAKIKSIIEAFASDPKHPHYEKVKPVMASLLTSGGAKDMEDAYDRACHADPDIRASILVDQQRASEEKRIAEKKAKAEAARNAASSIKGSPGLNGAEITKGPKLSLKDELRANYRAATEH